MSSIAELSGMCPRNCSYFPGKARVHCLSKPSPANLPKRGILHLRGSISHFLDFQMLKVASSPKRSLTMLSQGTEKKKPGGSNSTSCLGLGKESFPVVIFKIFRGQLRSPVVVHVGLAHVEHVLSQGGNLFGNGSYFSMLQEVGSSSRDAGDNGSLLTRCF